MRLSARERAGPGAGTLLVPPRAAEPARVPASRLRALHLAVGFLVWGLGGKGLPGFLQPERSSVERAWEPVLLPENREKGAETPTTFSFGDKKAMSHPTWR